MEKLNVVVKLLEEKDVKILKLENDLRETKEYFDKAMKKRNLEVTNSKGKVDKVKGKELEYKTSEKLTSTKFECELCGFQSSSKQGLKTHISRKHTKYNEEVLSIKCEICTSEFTSSKEMKKHMICHSYKDSSILKYKCDFWGPNRITLQVHFRRSHSENISCALCDFEAKDFKTLSIHTFSCEMYECNECKQNFNNFQDVKTHVNQDHNGKNLLLNHFCCERENQEFFQEKTHFSRDLFKKK